MAIAIGMFGVVVDDMGQSQISIEIGLTQSATVKSILAAKLGISCDGDRLLAL